MSENEETNWRLSVKPKEAEEEAAELSSEEDEKKEELQQTIQAKAEEIGGGGKESVITEPEQESISEALKKRERKAKRHFIKKRELDTSKRLANIPKLVESQANQLTRIEKAIASLQKSVNRIDKQSNTTKQLYVAITQLQRQVRSSKNRKQIKVLKRR